MGEYVEHLQEVHSFLDGVHEFLKNMKVGACVATVVVPSEIVRHVSEARQYMNTLNEYWKHYRRLKDLADMEWEVAKLEYKEEYLKMLYNKEEPISGKTVEERAYRAKEALTERGVTEVPVKKAEFRAMVLKTCLDLVDKDYKNLDKTRRDLVVQLECIKVEKGLLFSPGGDESL